MKKVNLKYILSCLLMTVVVLGCKDKDFEDHKYQSVDSHGIDQNIISTAVTTSKLSEFIIYSVDAATTPVILPVIRVALTAKNPASQDIHIKFVPATDSLDNYNAAHETAYIMPGAPGTPAFTTNAEAIIPKGSFEGFMNITITPADLFSADQYAFAYRIESVQESGYTISGNNNFAIAVVLPKNAYDGIYSVGPGKIERFTGGVPNTGDNLQGSFTSLADVPLSTLDANTLSYVPVWADGSPVGGIDGTKINIDPAAQPDGTHLVTMTCTTNSSMMDIAGETNNYDPATKTFNLAFVWGTANVRTYRVKLVYKGSR